MHLENYCDCEKHTCLQFAALLAKSTRVRRNKSLIVVTQIGPIKKIKFYTAVRMIWRFLYIN